MTNYINQLLDDMKKAEQNLPPSPNYKVLYPDHPAHDYGLEHIVAWECTPNQTMAELYGISPDAFPPPEKLTEAHIAALVEGIKSLWLAYGTDVSIPDNATMLLCYKVFTKEWREGEVQYFPPEMGGFSTYDFCSGCVESCVWEEACSCQHYAAEWEQDYKDFEKSEEGKTERGNDSEILYFYKGDMPNFDTRTFEDGELPF